jgi:ATP-dependent DNA helicase RecQ
MMEHPTVLALTATASPLVREEIVRRLGMRDPRIIVKGIDRPTIWLAVEHFSDETTKQQALLARVIQAEKPGIVYVATRQHAEEIAAALAAEGVQALSYHAGMKNGDRESAQTAFMKGEAEVMVATVAFGMGIDKENVRFVYHYDVSGSLDAYYQEIGRAGRDDEAAEAILFYNPNDLSLQRFFASQGQLDEAEVERVLEALPARGRSIEVEELRQAVDLPQGKLTTILNRLEDIGAIAVQPSGEVAGIGRAADKPGTAEEAASAQAQRRQFEQSRLQMMRGYAELTGCRRAYLLNYFGQEYEGRCGFCDNCQDETVPATEVSSQQPFPVNSRVAHETWGEGTVLRYELDKMFVLFDAVGYKTLATHLVSERELLRPV